MATIYILLHLLALHALFSDVKGINFLTNNSILDLNSTELVTALITEQARICPYIALCNSPNSSVFTPRFSFILPCCQKCSCDNTCIAEDSCCPDFNEEIFRRTVLPSEKTTKIVSSNMNETAEDRQLCVQTQHGSIPNRDGVTMVALCPSTFKDLDVKRKCEMKFDYLSTFDLYDHIPVTDTVSGLTFKNRFCELCYKDRESLSATFWNVSLKCKRLKFVFYYFPVKNPFDFAATTLLDKSILCNIAFKYEHVMMGLDFAPKSCQADNIIDSCYDKNSNYILQTLCSKYFWPIKARVFLGTRIYKNYACMLCNGIEFKERCDIFHTEQKNKFEVSLKSSISNTKQIPTLLKSDYDTNTTNPSLESKVIERYFPNNDGDVHCQKGFVYDSTKDTCRLVICPLYFFVKDGDCVPVFETLTGIVYQVLLEAYVPFNLHKKVKRKVETAIATSLDILLRDRIGEGQYEFDIWQGSTMPLQVSEYQRYLIVLAISGNFGQGKYISILKLINNLVLLNQPLKITIENEKKKNIFNVYISFNTSSEVYNDWTPRTLYCTDCFYLIKSNNELGNEKIKNSGTPLFISPMNLCYSISLYEHEFKYIGLNSGYISVASNVLVQPNYERVYLNNYGSELNLVCLDHAFNHIPKIVSYIFLNKNDTNYKFRSRPTPNSDKNYNDIDGIQNKETSFAKSTAATLGTLAVVASVIVIRQIMKRLTARGRNTEPAEEIVTEMAVRYRVSLDEGSNTDAERRKEENQ